MRWRDLERRVDALIELATDPLFDQVDAGLRVAEAHWRLRRLGLHLVERGMVLCDLGELDVERLEAARYALGFLVAACPAWDDVKPVPVGDEATNPEKLQRVVVRLDRAIECWIADLYHYLEAVAAVLAQRPDLQPHQAVSALRTAMGSANNLLVMSLRARDELRALGFDTPYTPDAG